MARKSRSAGTQAYMDAVAGLGCLACLLDGLGATPASLHHPRAGKGLSERGSDMDVIGLCPAHHVGDGKPRNFVSIHKHPAKFAERYGDEEFLSELARRLVKKNLLSM